MRIALITLHNANNYGAVLQTFATTTILSRYGNVEIINYRNNHISSSFDLIRLKASFHGALGAGKDLLRCLPRRRAIGKFKAFMNERMSLTPICTNSELRVGKQGRFDCYIAGSDQIWNPECVSAQKILDCTYLLDFVADNATKISYASSFGSYKFSEREQDEIKEHLSTFDMISVREEGSQTYLSKLLNCHIYHTLDPTLLLSKSEWLAAFDLLHQTHQGHKYILLYTVPKAPLIRQVVDFFHRKTGWKIIALDQGLSAGARVDRIIRDAGPIDFIQLFSGAELVITDSFHGVCFSLNFGIPFVAVSPGKYSNRIESLLSVVGLQSRLVNRLDHCEDLPVDFDFSEAHEKLSISRQASIDVLARAIGPR